MQKIEPPLMAVILSQEHILETIFRYVPLSSAPKITCVSKTFREVWNKTRYEPALKSLFQSDIYFSKLQNAVRTLHGESSALIIIHKDLAALRTVKKTVETALEFLCPSDKKNFFAHMRPELWWLNQFRIVAIFIHLKYVLFPWTPPAIDLLEDPELLISTCERAMVRQTFSSGVYFPGPYNDL